MHIVTARACTCFAPHLSMTALRGGTVARGVDAVQVDWRFHARMADELLRIDRHLRIPRSEIRLRASRSSGPGGRHANVTASRVEASFDVAASRSLTDAQRARLLAGVGPRATAVAQEHRSQARNRALALERLRRRLAAALTVAGPRRRPTVPHAQRQLRLAAKRHRSERKRARQPPEQ